MDSKFQSFKSALAEAAYCYKTSIHRSTGFAPATLHTGQLMFSPGILHPDNTPPLPPSATGPDHKGFLADLDNFRELARSVVDFNRAEAQRQEEQYYTQLTLQIKKGSWVLVLSEGMLAPEGDRIPNRKLSCKWAGPFRFEGMANPALAKLQRVDEQGRAIKEFLVHASKVRLYKCP